MTSLRLSRCHRHGIVTENLLDGHCLTTVTGMSRSGVGIDVSYLSRVYATILKSQLQRACRTSHIRRRDVVSVAAESPAYNLSEYGSTALNSMLIALQNYRSSTSSRHKAITILIKRAASLCWFVLASRECLYTVKTCNNVGVVLLSTTRDDAVTQAVLDEEVRIAYGERRARTRCRTGQIYATQAEKASQIHRDC